MGDRAILDGIIKIFSKTYETCNIAIGSLYPFFTEHTLLKDKEEYLNENNKIKLSIFDQKSTKELKENIKKSDLVIMGGGPIMDLEELYIIKKGFEIAHHNKIKTCLFGCGIGPLNNDRLINVTKQILKNTDLGIFRDENSKELANKYMKNKEKRFYYLPDPAVVSILLYKENNKDKVNSNNDIVVNFRKHPIEYGNCNNNIENILSNIVKSVSNKYDNVKLIPMHTFFIGGDDRAYLSKIKNIASGNNIEVINKPMSLYDMYKIYSEAKACIGMRYHSVVMQTILNGNNYIIDYTSPKTGKIAGFINELENKEFYNNRYYNYTTGETNDVDNMIKVLTSNEKYNYSYVDIVSKYHDLLEEEL